MLPLLIRESRIPAKSRILLPQLLAGLCGQSHTGKNYRASRCIRHHLLEEQDILACLKQEGEIQIALISPVGFSFNRLLRRHGGKTIGKLVIIARTVTPRKGSGPRDYPLAGCQLSGWGERHGIMDIQRSYLQVLPSIIGLLELIS